MPFHLYLLGAFGILFLFLGASELLYRLPLVSVVTKDQIMQTWVPHLYLCLCICVFVYLSPTWKDQNQDFHLLCRLLGHLALEHEVLEDVRLEHQLERLRGSLGSEKPVCVQLLRLQRLMFSGQGVSTSGHLMEHYPDLDPRLSWNNIRSTPAKGLQHLHQGNIFWYKTDEDDGTLQWPCQHR